MHPSSREQRVKTVGISLIVPATLCVGLAGLGLPTPAHGQTPVPPPPPPAEIRSLIGDYTAGDRMVYVTEIAGTLRVRTSAFGSRPLGAAGIRLENGVLWVDGSRFARRDVASGTFRIEPVRPVAQLRPLALAATPG